MSKEQRLIEIETKVAYQEDLIQSLNEIVSQQQQELEHLRLQQRTLVERMQSLVDSVESGRDEPPPHY